MRRVNPILRTPALFAALVFLGGCWTPPGVVVLGYETNDDACSNGLDDDRDGQIDCLDDDCLRRSTLCGEVIPLVPTDDAENTYVTCNDFIDNDGDGQFDCGDRDCQAIPENCCSNEFTNEACSDRRDNDANGFADCRVVVAQEDGADLLQKNNT